MKSNSTLAIVLLAVGIFLFASPYFGGNSEVNPPRPPVPPVPLGEKIVVTVSETLERTPSQATVLNSLQEHLRSLSPPQKFRMMDKDQAKTSPWLQPILSHLSTSKTSLPALMVIVRPEATPDEYVYLAVDTLPGGPREAISFVDEALGRE